MESRKRSGAISLMAVMGGEGSGPERISKLCRWQLSEVQTWPRAEWCEVLRERGCVRNISRRCWRTAHQHSKAALNLSTVSRFLRTAYGTAVASKARHRFGTSQSFRPRQD